MIKQGNSRDIMQRPHSVNLYFCTKKLVALTEEEDYTVSTYTSII